MVKNTIIGETGQILLESQYWTIEMYDNFYNYGGNCSGTFFVTFTITQLCIVK